MAESPFNQGHSPNNSLPRRPAAPPSRSQAQQGEKISCRATNPLSLQDDLGKVFLDENQAKATTATRLFRNDDLFEATRRIVAGFLSANQTGRFCLWSTGCSSGEEVYSMAMIALNEFARVKKPGLLEAFGTDINAQRITEGRLGRYGRPREDAFDKRYWQLLRTYAAIDATHVQMGDPIRSVCKFTLFDMRKKPKKHTFHFIVCNHVLQYYDAPGQRHIIGNLTAVLRPGGYLYLEGVTEHGLDGLGLEKAPNFPNLYMVASRGGGLKSPLFNR